MSQGFATNNIPVYTKNVSDRAYVFVCVCVVLLCVATEHYGNRA